MRPRLTACPAMWNALRSRARAAAERRESGQISLLILGFTIVAAMLIVGTVAVTSAQLSRMRLLDVSDGAALDAADALDQTAYDRGLGAAVPLSDESVRSTATSYLAARPLPVGMESWQVAPGTGTPDGETAVVRLVGEADLPLVGGLLSALGGSVTITVESSARSELQ
jgi:hypothetical protein